MIYKTVDGHTLALYVNEPAEPSAKLRAAVVFLNGGGWTGDLPQQFNQQSNTVAEHGAVGIEVKYRLLNKRDRTTPPRICVEDAKSAIRWVSSHASELKIDPNRIAAAGGSAGGGTWLPTQRWFRAGTLPANPRMFPQSPTRWCSSTLCWITAPTAAATLASAKTISGAVLSSSPQAMFRPC